MTDVLAQSVGESERPPARPAQRARQRASSAEALAKRLGLKITNKDALTIRRRRCGRGWAYSRADGSPIRDRGVIRRLNSLAVPPAYTDVLYAEDPSAHLQAIGRDAA